jgi:hypothetical protein
MFTKCFLIQSVPPSHSGVAEGFRADAGGTFGRGQNMQNSTATSKGDATRTDVGVCAALAYITSNRFAMAIEAILMRTFFAAVINSTRDFSLTYTHKLD